MEKEIAKNAKKTKSGISELKYKKENGEENKTSTDKEKAEVLVNFSAVYYSSMNQMGKYQILN